MVFAPGKLCVMVRDENGLAEGTKVYVRRIPAHGNSRGQRVVSTMDNSQTREVWITSLVSRRGRPRTRNI
jgi:hypothetical protein